MDRENTIIIAAVLFILAVVLFYPLEPEETEPQLIKIGVLTCSKESNASEAFLANLAINDVNLYCINDSLPYRFKLVFKCSEKRAQHAIEMTDEFHSENVSIVVGYPWGSMLDACDYQSKSYGMVIISPDCNSAVHRDVYKHIFQLTPITFHEAQVIARSMIELGFTETVVYAKTNRHVDYIFDEFMKFYTELGGTVSDIVTYSYSTDTDYINKNLVSLEDAITKDFAIFSIDASPHSPFCYELYNHPKLLNHTWFGTRDASSNHTATISVIPELAEIKMINPVLDKTPDQTNTLYCEINERYYAEFGKNMTRYTGNMYDAVMLSALTVIEIGEYNNLTFIETFPEIARNYIGVSGNCSLDQYGDRLHAGYHIYKYVLQGWDVYLKEIGYYDTEETEIHWTELE